jgi:hypothetical protein
MRLVQLFTTEQLEALSEKQLHILRHVIEQEILTNPEILRILREKFNPIRDRMAAQAAPPRARASGPRRPPGSST